MLNAPPPGLTASQGGRASGRRRSVRVSYQISYRGGQVWWQIVGSGQAGLTTATEAAQSGLGPVTVLPLGASLRYPQQRANVRSTTFVGVDGDTNWRTCGGASQC